VNDVNGKLRHCAYVLAGWALFAPPAWAGNATEPVGEAIASPSVGMGTADLLPSLWRLFGALALVLVLVWGTMWLARRVLRGRVAGVNRSDLKVIDRVYLAPRRSVEIVSVGNRVLVLGVTDQAISMLTELSDEDIPSTALPHGTDAATGTGARAADLWRSARRRLSDRLQRVRATSDTQVPAAHPAAKS